MKKTWRLRFKLWRGVHFLFRKMSLFYGCRDTKHCPQIFGFKCIYCGKWKVLTYWKRLTHKDVDEFIAKAKRR